MAMTGEEGEMELPAMYARPGGTRRAQVLVAVALGSLGPARDVDLQTTSHPTRRLFRRTSRPRFNVLGMKQHLRLFHLQILHRRNLPTRRTFRGFPLRPDAFLLQLRLLLILQLIPPYRPFALSHMLLLVLL